MGNQSVRNSTNIRVNSAQGYDGVPGYTESFARICRQQREFIGLAEADVLPEVMIVLSTFRLADAAELRHLRRVAHMAEATLTQGHKEILVVPTFFSHIMKALLLLSSMLPGQCKAQHMTYYHFHRMSQVAI